MQLPEHARINEAAWNARAAEYAEPARRIWVSEEISWGIWGVPEAQIQALPEVDGLDVIDLGCGTAYFSAWLARRGARPIGVDLSEKQLATARAIQHEHGLEFPLIHASAEHVPLAKDCADLVISEYGASLWCDPDAWLAEAARLLRPGGRLVFLTSSLLFALTAPDQGPATDRLLRDQRGVRAVTYPDDPGVEFHLSPGDWIATLGRHGFAVQALHELYAPEDASPSEYEWITLEWARRWPFEEVWCARRR